MKCIHNVIAKSDNCIAPETPPAFPSGRVRIADENVMTNIVPIHSLERVRRPNLMGGNEGSRTSDRPILT